ncbi:hypothetical protein PHSY_004491 [Pseudozyma hubeiensis SY62]|uniref:Uncharacterized protein n=1 Tax=Pseudozyma hubeiensis (strain SY62) TaxID=1305764 RepID=R9P6Q1_PSEHS|nr:hypothetical protein PHSY_004491 [Pseudozyma hubeiensis SY62]GAC96907.1 hypothetical protein PHSY_004491 [Pseudozyma hubeiensis SY62]
MHASPALTNEPSNLTKMLAFFRKSKSSSVMANANTSDTTLVSTTQVSSGKPKRKTPRETVPYQAEFSGMGMMGGMPAMGGHMFLEPPSPTESAASKKSVKMVPGQPFKSSPKASFVSARAETAKGRDSFDTMTTTVSTTAGGSTSPQRKLLKQHKAFFNNSFSNT